MAQLSCAYTTTPQDCADRSEFKLDTDDRLSVIFAIDTTGTRDNEKRQEREKHHHDNINLIGPRIPGLFLSCYIKLHGYYMEIKRNF